MKITTRKLPKRRNKAGWRTFLPTICLCLLALQGCDPVKRHRVLTLFFDGVPPLEASHEKEGIAENTVSKEGDKTARFKKREKKKVDYTYKRKRVGVQHPPYAMKMCDGCHKVGRSTGAPEGFAFLEEKTKLCALCHDDKSQEELGNTYKWVHAPVQYGACIECHHPHQSANEFMLKKWPIQELCLKCHDRKRLFKTEMHSEIGETDCTDCHDPHGSEERYMLRM